MKLLSSNMLEYIMIALVEGTTGKKTPSKEVDPVDHDPVSRTITGLA